MSSGESIQVSQQLNYQQPSLVCPAHEFVKLLPNQGQNQPITNSRSELVFELPATVYNLKDSIFEILLTPPTSGGANNYNWFFSDLPNFLYQLQLYDASNTMLVDIMDIDKYCHLSWNVFTRIDDLLSSPSPQSNIPIDLFGPNSTDANNANTSFNFMQNYSGSLGSEIGHKLSLEPQHLLRGDANSATPVLRIRIPLGRLGLNSILNYDKDLYFGRIMYLRLGIKSSVEILFRSTGVADAATNPALTPLAPVGNIVVENTALYLSTETNIVIQNEIKMKYLNGGLQYNFDNVRSYKQNFAGTANSTDSFNLKINRYHGKKLKYVMWCPYNPTTTTNNNNLRVVITTTDAQNNNNAFITNINSFYSQMDNKRLQQFNVSIPNYDHWTIQKNKLKGSCILDPQAYTVRQFVWIDDFSGSDPYVNKPDADCGLPLDQERDYQVYITNGAVDQPKNYYIYVVASQTLLVSPQIMQFM